MEGHLISLTLYAFIYHPLPYTYRATPSYLYTHTLGPPRLTCEASPPTCPLT